MSSALPTSANDYLAPPAPAKLILNREVWNSVLGSIGSRLRVLEDVNSGIETLKLELQNFGIQRLDEAITPLIEDTQASLALLQSQVAQAQAELDDTIDDATAAFDAAVQAANVGLAAVQAQIDAIIAGATFDGGTY